jgi:GntR family transcriptional regulator
LGFALTQGSPISYSIPLYIQIAEGLIAQIESGALCPGEQLPPERELSENFGVTRMTLRRALRVLEGQGLIIRKHGIGTYIAEPKIDRKMEVVFRFSSDMQQRGFKPQAKLISFEQIMAESSMARDLLVPISAQIYSILRLRSINQEPVMLESYLIPLSRFPGLDQYDLENRSIYEILEDEYGVPIARARQSFEPVIATDFEAKLLNITVGDALMMEKRLSYDVNNLPIEIGKDRYRGDRFRFVTEAVPFSL